MKTLKGFFYVPWHGEVNGFFMIIPNQQDCTEEFTCPVYKYCVVFLQGFFEMFCMCEDDVFDAKIIDNQTECDWALLVMQEAWCELALVIPMCLKATGKEFVGKESCL